MDKTEVDFNSILSDESDEDDDNVPDLKAGLVSFKFRKAIFLMLYLIPFYFQYKSILRYLKN